MRSSLANTLFVIRAVVALVTAANLPLLSLFLTGFLRRVRVHYWGLQDRWDAVKSAPDSELARPHEPKRCMDGARRESPDAAR